MHSMNRNEIDDDGFNSMAERNRTAILNEGDKMCDEETIFVVRNSVGVMAYAAKLEKLSTGEIMVIAGSARWILTAGMRAYPLDIGECFKHWLYGEIKVTKINKKTIKAEQVATGEMVTLHI